MVQVRCYLPGIIKAGFYRTTPANHGLEIGVDTAGGMILMKLNDYERALSFAKAFMNATSRHEYSIALDPEKFNNLKGVQKALTEEDRVILPLIPGDTIVDVFIGQKDFQKFCSTAYYPLRLLKHFVQISCCLTLPDAPMCSKENCSYPFFPWVIYLGTCALRPFRKTDDLVVTENSIISLQKSGNSGLCGYFFRQDATPCYDGPCAIREQFCVAWVSLQYLRGHVQAVLSFGSDNFTTRVGKDCFGLVGEVCCPLSDNRFVVSIDLGGYGFSLEGRRMNENVAQNDDVLRLNGLLDNLEYGVRYHALEEQQTLLDKKMQRV